MDYTIEIEIYGDKPTRLTIPTTWEVGIKQVSEISEQFSKKNWTRHSTVGGPISHLDHYADLYNEGSVILTKPKLTNGK